MEPLVSVDCTTYNHATYIRQCLDGFVMQKTNFPIEIIVHDDASTDGTADIIREYEAKYPNLIKPIYQSENQYSKGVNVWYTYVRPMMKGKYIAFCNGDDYWTDPLKLQKQVDFLESHSEYSLCTSGYMINKNGVMIESVIKRGSQSGFAYPDEGGWYWKTLTAVVRRDSLAEYFRNYKYFKYLKDTHLFYYALKAGMAWYISECFGVYNIHPGCIWGSLSDAEKIVTDYKVHKELYKVTKDKYAYDLYYPYIQRRLNNHLYKNKCEKMQLLYEHYNRDMQTRKHAIKILLKKIINKMNNFRNLPPLKLYYLLACIFDVRLKGSLKDTSIHIHTTTGCNYHCKFCSYIERLKTHPRVDIDFKILYEYLLPLYKECKMVHLTGGEALIVSGLYEYCQYLSSHYPGITIYIESNGMAFDEKWQRLAADNLIMTHFSVNGSDGDAFAAGCWAEGREAYKKSQKNILSYMRLLRENGLEVFAPLVTMVINKESAYDIVDFLHYALRDGFCACAYMFDYNESNMDAGTFKYPEIMYPVYRELLKLERLLAGKFKITFRLFRPLANFSELDNLETDVNAIPFDRLKEEYADIWELAKGRNIKEEILRRQEIRKTHNKKLWTKREEVEGATWHYKKVGNFEICHNPFNALNIKADGTFDACTKIVQRFNFNNFVAWKKSDWNRNFINSPIMKKWRFDILHGTYNYCQKSCPYQFPRRSNPNDYEAIFGNEARE
ncbi:MAG: glycosyltransferase [Bacteroidales bacterium]|jgi:glycosyltransferase involved in cell wall biosynthesis|nr:glycosyltransferase [Bacteroidales bacterium]